jgi:hypothetical protein
MRFAVGTICARSRALAAEKPAGNAYFFPALAAHACIGVIGFARQSFRPIGKDPYQAGPPRRGAQTDI